MTTISERRLRSRRQDSYLVIGMAAILMAATIVFIVRQSEVMAVKRRLANLEEEIAYYRSMNLALEERLKVLSSDEYIERVAREKLGLVKPGEVLLVPVKHQGQ